MCLSPTRERLPVKMLYIPNFDFEYQLGERLRRQIPATAVRLSRELAAVWVGVALPGDFIWIDGGVEPGFFDGLTDVGLPPVTVVNHPSAITEPVELSPWGWTDELRMRAAAHGWLIRAPNSRPSIGPMRGRSRSLSNGAGTSDWKGPAR